MIYEVDITVEWSDPYKPGRVVTYSENRRVSVEASTETEAQLLAAQIGAATAQGGMVVGTRMVRP